MWIIELAVVLVFIWLGARMGSIGIGFAGGFGVLVLSLVFGITQSGETADTLAALRETKRKGHRTLAICNGFAPGTSR